MKRLTYLLLTAILLPLPVLAAEPAETHGKNMQHCMPDMDAHCRMNEAMEQMQKGMDAHGTMQHCMPNMTAHCQTIADLEYMGQRMADMRVNMQHCMENEKDCTMPEMAGEMMAMRKKMDEMATQMQSQSGIKPDAKDSMSDEFHQHERERNIQ